MSNFISQNQVFTVNNFEYKLVGILIITDNINYLLFCRRKATSESNSFVFNKIGDNI